MAKSVLFVTLAAIVFSSAVVRADFNPAEIVVNGLPDVAKLFDNLPITVPDNLRSTISSFYPTEPAVSDSLRTSAQGLCSAGTYAEQAAGYTTCNYVIGQGGLSVGDDTQITDTPVQLELGNTAAASTNTLLVAGTTQCPGGNIDTLLFPLCRQLAMASVDGVHFSHRGLPTIVPVGEGESIFFLLALNPGIAAGPDGTFYYAYHVIGLQGNGILMARSTDGLNWELTGSPVVFNPWASETITIDGLLPKISVAVNQYNGAVYVTWVRVTLTDGLESFESSIVIAASDNGGDSWSSPVTVSDTNGILNLYPNVEIERATGTVHVVWNFLNVIVHDNSSPSLSSFGTDTVAYVGNLFFSLQSCEGSFYLGTMSPVMKIGANGIYVVFVDSISAIESIIVEAADLEVLFIRSTDGGDSWSSAVSLSNAPESDQWVPTLSVVTQVGATSTYGGTCYNTYTDVLVVSWYDRRTDIIEDGFCAVERFATESVNNGVTFVIPEQISEVTSESPLLTLYEASAPFKGAVYPFWAVWENTEIDELIDILFLESEIHTAAVAINNGQGSGYQGSSYQAPV